MPDPGPPPEPTNQCTVELAPPGPHCTSKLEALTLRYLGGSCNDWINRQDKKCEDSGAGPPGTSEPVQFVVSGTGRDSDRFYLDTGPVAVSPDGGVDIGDLVTAVAGAGGKREFGSTTMVQICNDQGQLLETAEIHTSCSKPLNIGDVFGGVEVVGFDFSDGTSSGGSAGGTLVEYTYEVTNPNPSAVENVSIEDDVVGTVASGVTIAPGDTYVATASDTISSTTTNIATLEGDLQTGRCVKAPPRRR